MTIDKLGLVVSSRLVRRVPAEVCRRPAKGQHTFFLHVVRYLSSRGAMSIFIVHWLVRNSGGNGKGVCTERLDSKAVYTRAGLLWRRQIVFYWSWLFEIPFAVDW